MAKEVILDKISWIRILMCSDFISEHINGQKICHRTQMSQPTINKATRFLMNNELIFKKKRRWLLTEKGNKVRENLFVINSELNSKIYG